MCDYSLEHVDSRPARVGDRLVSTAFPTAITRGFCESGNPHLAVCLLPGTELVFDRDVEYDFALGFTPTRRLPERAAIFRHFEPDRPHQHHDALAFPSGRTVLVTRLIAGQHATVLQLPVTAEDREHGSEHRPEVTGRAVPVS